MTETFVLNQASIPTELDGDVHIYSKGWLVPIAHLDEQQLSWEVVSGAAPLVADEW